MVNLYTVLKTGIYSVLVALFLVACGGETAASTGGTTPPVTAPAPGEVNTAPVKYPSQPSDCGSDCPPVFPAS